jgi:hypothetical protein
MGLGWAAPAVSVARAPASIEFLNPSSFATNSTGTIVVSDRAVTRPRSSPEGYRISAWTRNAPPDAGVEFELLSNGVSLETLDAVSEIGPDTFDYKWDIPNTMPDGAYTLRATLFSQNEAIDHVDKNITIIRLGDKATVDYPTRTPGSAWPTDGSFGTYRPLAPALPKTGIAQRGKPVGNIDTSHTVGTELTSGTTRVRAFYTTAAPGTAPQWKACGTEKTPGHPVPSSAANDGVRCTLASSADQKQVTAVAVVANSSPGEYEPAANGAGDAIRVGRAYAQRPKTFSIVEGDGGVLEENPNGGFPCHTVVSHLEDFKGREIVAANVDVHATGPTDKLRLDTGLLPHSGITHADRNHSLAEPGFDCFGENEQSTSDQSEHQILGGPDMKHAEADSFGTDDEGNWGFSFKVPANQVGSERFSVHAWTHVDEGDDGCHANDDSLRLDELVDTTSVGLDRAPATTPPPVASAEERCDRLPALRTIGLSAGRRRVPIGQTVDLRGAILGIPRCIRGQSVRLRSRKPGERRFTGSRTARSRSNGRFSFQNIRVNKTLEYRASVRRTSRCVAATSEIVKVRARR